MKKVSFVKSLATFSLLLMIFMTGCKRTEIFTTPDTTPTTPIGGAVNDAEQVIGSVNGIVLDENNVPLSGAFVTSGSATTTTNTNGIFIFQNISLSKENGSVTVLKAGFFKSIRSFKTTAGKNNSVRIQMMQKTLSGTVNSTAGGIINSNGGAMITFPANAFVTSTGATYTGTVRVFSRWIDPSAANLPFVIPGDLRGLSTNGAEKILETYGMVGAELADASGNILRIATGKTATISFPITANSNGTAPASIALWHFDDASARWKENGTAIKTGNIYTAQVDKFSFWNVDVPNDFIKLDFTLINAITNSPFVSTNTRIRKIINGTYGFCYTNNTGFASLAVPKNEALVLEVVATTVCGTIFFTQNIGPFSVNTSLGNINVSLPSSQQIINFSGTIVNCGLSPINNGYISFYGNGGSNAFVSTNATGSFSFSIINCSGNNLPFSYQAIDYSTSQQSSLLTGVATSSTVNLGNVTACGTSIGANVYVAGAEGNSNGFLVAKFWKNGVPTNLTNGTSNAQAYSVFISSDNIIYVAGYENVIANPGNNGISIAKIWKNGVSSNLTNGNISAIAKSVFVSGSDVYVAGYESNFNNFPSVINRAVLWKNGVATYLTDGIRDGAAGCVFVSGNDVYVGGYEDNNAPPPTINRARAKFWKNGISTNLTDGTTNFGYVNSIFVLGSDVYCAGSERNPLAYSTAKFWKNGLVTNLTNGSNEAIATSIYVNGNDVYVAGHENITPSKKIAKIWKNAVVTNLTDGTLDSYASSVFVHNSNVYVVGGSYNPAVTINRFFATSWKNGLPTYLTDGFLTTFTASVFVK